MADNLKLSLDVSDLLVNVKMEQLLVLPSSLTFLLSGREVRVRHLFL
jgi:hypothetical protein